MTRSPAEMATQAAVLALFHAITPAMVHRQLWREADARPGTIVAFTHTSDLDVPVAVTSVIPPRLGARWVGHTTFAGKSDLFLPGFLALAFPQLGPLRRPLFGLGLEPVLRTLRIVPVSKSGPRLAAEWLDNLQELDGPDALAAPLLSSAWQQELHAAGVPSDATLSQLHSWRYHALLSREAGAELLAPEVAHRLRLHEARAARETLDALARPLRQGALLFMAPEGGLSPDGTLQPFRSGLYRLLREAPHADVLPLGITYDRLSRGRPSVFVRAGEPLSGLAAGGRRELDERLRSEFRRLHTVTLPQLAAALLLPHVARGARQIGVARLATALFVQARTLAEAGVAVDPEILTRRSFVARLRRFLRAAENAGLRTWGSEIALDRNVLLRRVRSRTEAQANPLGYALNQLGRLPPAARAQLASAAPGLEAAGA